MLSMGKDMQAKTNPVVGKRLRKQETILDRHRCILGGMPQERTGETLAHHILDRQLLSQSVIGTR